MHEDPRWQFLCLKGLMMVFTAPESQLLTESDCTLRILHKAKPVPSVSSGTGLVTSSSGSSYKFTSAVIAGARNVVSILFHCCQTSLVNCSSYCSCII
jgi:hypothetical protein